MSLKPFEYFVPVLKRVMTPDSVATPPVGAYAEFYNSEVSGNPLSRKDSDGNIAPVSLRIWDIQVVLWSQLPAYGDNIGKIAYVQNGSLLNLKKAGFYLATATEWKYLGTNPGSGNIGLYPVDETDIANGSVPIFDSTSNTYKLGKLETSLAKGVLSSSGAFGAVKTSEDSSLYGLWLVTVTIAGEGATLGDVWEKTASAFAKKYTFAQAGAAYATTITPPAAGTYIKKDGNWSLAGSSSGGGVSIGTPTINVDGVGNAASTAADVYYTPSATVRYQFQASLTSDFGTVAEDSGESNTANPFKFALEGTYYFRCRVILASSVLGAKSYSEWSAAVQQTVVAVSILTPTRVLGVVLLSQKTSEAQLLAATDSNTWHSAATGKDQSNTWWINQFTTGYDALGGLTGNLWSDPPANTDQNSPHGLAQESYPSEVQFLVDLGAVKTISKLDIVPISSAQWSALSYLDTAPYISFWHGAGWTEFLSATYTSEAQHSFNVTPVQTRYLMVRGSGYYCSMTRMRIWGN